MFLNIFPIKTSRLKMLKTAKKIAAILISGLTIWVAAYFIVKWVNGLFEPEKKQPEKVSVLNTTVITVDTAAIVKKFEAQLKVKLTAELKAERTPRDIMVITAVNIDSIIAEAKAYWEKELKDSVLTGYLFTASADTMIYLVDTTGNHGNIRIYTDYTSPVPLHPAGTLNLGADVNLLAVNKTVTSSSFEEKTNVIKELPVILIGFGTEGIFRDNVFRTVPFVDLSYNKKVWFFYWITRARSEVLMDAGSVKLAPAISTQVSIGF
jgi:hypothetical protein